MIGGCYVLLASSTPLIRTGFGTAFGIALWVVGDEIPITLSAISDPRSKTVASLAAAVLAHVIFGAAVEAATKALPR
jgi:uncharacterized membrane protein YagU involved in acid resistance